MSKLYTSLELAEKLGVKKRLISDYVRQGRIKAISLTGKVTPQRGNRAMRFTQEAIDDFLKANEIIPDKD